MEVRTQLAVRLHQFRHMYARNLSDHPKTRNIQISITTNTTTLSRLLMALAIGTKELISHITTPTTTNISTISTRVITSITFSWKSRPQGTCGRGFQLNSSNQHQNEPDYQYSAYQAAGKVTPVGAVWVDRDRTDQGQDQDNQKYGS